MGIPKTRVNPYKYALEAPEKGAFYYAKTKNKFGLIISFYQFLYEQIINW